MTKFAYFLIKIWLGPRPQTPIIKYVSTENKRLTFVQNALNWLYIILENFKFKKMVTLFPVPTASYFHLY